MQEEFEKLVAEFDKRINTQLKIMAGLGDEIYRYGFGKSLEAYQQGKGIIEQTAAEYTMDGFRWRTDYRRETSRCLCMQKARR